jgi:DNA replication and repair protein RecF
VNGKRVAGMVEVIGIVPTVLFAPQDVMLASGPPASRRMYLDYTIAQISPAFLGNLRDYRRVVRSRNALLKKSLEAGIAAKEMEAWDEGLIEKGAAVVRDREEMTRVVSAQAETLFGELIPGGERLKVDYICSFRREGMSARDSLRQALREVRDAERRRGYTLVGPHFDDLALYVDDVSLRSYGSQGRKRLVAIVLKLTQAAIIMAKRAERPAVLLDDIFSEIDGTTAQRVREHLSDMYQSFITSPRPEELPSEGDKARCFTVERGKISTVESLS